jgi:DNA repair protein RadD
MLTAICIERDRKPGWIAHKYREKFGTWPAWGVTASPIPPTPEVRAWVRSRDIAFAKSQAPRLTVSSSGRFNSNLPF